MYTAQSAQKAYKTTSIQTASQGRLIAMLFEGAARFMNQFRDAVGARKFEEAHENSVKAQRILTELIIALDHQKAPEISAVLQAAYEDIRSRMAVANIRKETSGVSKFVADLEAFRETWTEVFKKVDGEQRTTAPRQTGVSLRT